MLTIVTPKKNGKRYLVYEMESEAVRRCSNTLQQSPKHRGRKILTVVWVNAGTTTGLLPKWFLAE